jgi:hypothetical protein
MPDGTDPLSRSLVVHWKYGLATLHGVLVTTDTALREIDEALQFAERCADDVALGIAPTTMRLALVHRQPRPVPCHAATRDNISDGASRTGVR